VVWGGVGHRANNGRAVGQRCQARKLLAKKYARQSDADRLVRAAKFNLSVRLGIKRLELAGPAAEPNLNNRRIRLAPTGLCRLRAETKEIAQPKAEAASQKRTLHEATPGRAGMLPSVDVARNHLERSGWDGKHPRGPEMRCKEQHSSWVRLFVFGRLSR